MAESRENVENAVAGDIIGVYDTGTYQVGDTLTTGKLKKSFEPLPTFTPELFMRVQAKNVMKQKSFQKELTNWYKKEPFSSTNLIQLVILCLVRLGNFNLKSLKTGWSVNIILKQS